MTIAVKIIANSISSQGKQLPTFQLRYPKFIHGEFMTHRVLSRNASSSRAIPVERLIEDILREPAMPSFWGKNQPGMQAREQCDELVNGMPREKAWTEALDDMILIARWYAKAGYHKQIVNRLLEPFCHINVVCTATEWSNFFALRCHKDAQPEMRELAEKMQACLKASVPKLLQPGEWHVPYIDLEDREEAFEFAKGTHRSSEVYWNRLVKLSVARCARVSYLTHEGKKPEREKDFALYTQLIGSAPLHASPAEHQATPDTTEHVENNGTWLQPHLHGNFVGWIQFRKTLPGECQ